MKPGTEFALSVAGAALVGACAWFASAPRQAAARDAHQAELAACRIYDLLPAEKHTPSGDKLCRLARLECQDSGVGGAH